MLRRCLRPGHYYLPFGRYAIPAIRCGGRYGGDTADEVGGVRQREASGARRVVVTALWQERRRWQMGGQA